MSPASYQTAPPRVDVSAVDPSTRSAQSGKRDSNPRPQPRRLYTVGRPLAQPRDGGEGDRTPDLVNAIHALSQLSYAPAIFPRPKNRPAGTRHLIGALRRCQAISRSFHEHFHPDRVSQIT